MRLLRPRACAAALGVSTVTLWRWNRQGGGFPRPFRIGKQAIAWDEDEVRAWLNTCRGRPTSADPSVRDSDHCPCAEQAEAVTRGAR